MIYLAIGALALMAWMWTRSPGLRRGGWRIGSGLIALALIVVGAAVAIRGEWMIGIPLVATGLALATSSRVNRGGRGPRAGPSTQPAGQGMSAGEARAILGVAPTATVQEIQAAYTRLIKRAHPDSGGTTGLAAQLNAARDRLLKS